METRILLAADYANVDSAGKMNVLGAFNRIILQQFPGIHRSMHLVIRLAAELGEFNQERILKIVLFDQDANAIWSTSDVPFTIPMPKEGRTVDFNAVIAIRDMVFPKPGRYEFRVFVNSDLKGVVPIDLEQGGQPPAEG